MKKNTTSHGNSSSVEFKKIVISLAADLWREPVKVADFWEQHGFHRFPLKPGTKLPACSGYDKCDTHERFPASAFKDKDIGILFKDSNHIGFDIDPTPPEGMVANSPEWREWVKSGQAHAAAEKIIKDFPNLFSPSSPRAMSGKGFHYILRCPEAMEEYSQRSTEILHPLGKVEVFVQANAYFAVQPSRHPVHPDAYQWVRGGTIQSIKWQVVSNAIRDGLDRCRATRPAAKRQTPTPGNTSPTLTPRPMKGETAIEYAGRAPKSIDGVKGGGTTLGVLGRLRRLSKNDEDFMQAANHYNAHRCSPPWGGEQWQHKLDESAKSAFAKSNGTILPAGSLPRSGDTILFLLDHAGVLAHRNWRAPADVLVKVLPESPLATIGSITDSVGYWTPLTENLITALRAWAEEHIKIEDEKDGETIYRSFKISRADIELGIKSFAEETINPPAIAFEQWSQRHDHDPDWDCYLFDIWPELLQANTRPGVDTLGQSQDMVRMCARLIVLGIVTRTLEPGFKLDESVILIGEQASGKSIFTQLICPTYRSMGLYHPRQDARPHCTIDDMSGTKKEMAEIEADKMVVEFGELGGMHKACASKLKSYLTENELTYRPPYGREAIKQPRSSIFIGTSNQASGALPFDGSGNRRLIPLLLGRNVRAHKSIDPASVLTQERIEQIYGSAFTDYLKGERPNIQRDWIKTSLAEISKDHTPEIPQVDWIKKAIFELSSKPTPEDITLANIKALWKEKEATRDHSVANDTFSQIMEKLGYTRKQVRKSGSSPRRVWVKA